MCAQNLMVGIRYLLNLNLRNYCNKEAKLKSVQCQRLSEENKYDPGNFRRSQK